MSQADSYGGGAGGNDSGEDTLLTSQEGGSGGFNDARDTSGPAGAGAGKSAGQGNGVEGNDAADPDMAVPASADDYQFAFADSVEVNDTTLNTFKAKAHELGIPQGQAQKLVDFYVRNESQRSAVQLQAVAEMKQDWEQQIMSSPTFRRDAGEAHKTLVTFGSFGAVNERGEPVIHPDIKSIFDESLVGSHPKVFQMFVNIGKALAEPEARGRGVGGGKEHPLADRLWPDMK